MTEQYLDEGDTISFGGAEWEVVQVDPQIDHDEVYLERDDTRVFGEVNYNGRYRSLDLFIDSEEVEIR